MKELPQYIPHFFNSNSHTSLPVPSSLYQHHHYHQYNMPLKRTISDDDDDILSDDIIHSRKRQLTEMARQFSELSVTQTHPVWKNDSYTHPIVPPPSPSPPILAEFDFASESPIESMQDIQSRPSNPHVVYIDSLDSSDSEYELEENNNNNNDDDDGTVRNKNKYKNKSSGPEVILPHDYKKLFVSDFSTLPK